MAAEVVVLEVLVLTWEWAPSPRKICGCVPLPVSLHLLYGSPEEGRGPLGRGVSSFEGWMALRGGATPNTVAPHYHPLAIASVARSMANVTRCWMIRGETKGGSSIPLTCRTTRMWSCDHVPVLLSHGGPGKVCKSQSQSDALATCDTLSTLIYAALTETSGRLCWMYVVVARRCRSGGSSVARYQTQDYNLISLSGARNHFFLLLRVMWSALNTNTGKLLNADQSTIVVREMVN